MLTFDDLTLKANIGNKYAKSCASMVVSYVEITFQSKVVNSLNSILVKKNQKAGT